MSWPACACRWRPLRQRRRRAWRVAARARAGRVDLLSFGGTKNGLMLGEAVVVFDPALGAGMLHLRKQTLQLASKMRYMAAQFDALLDDELWRDAAHANAMARRLAEAVSDIRASR